MTDLCEALEVSESGYYAWRETKANRHDQRDAYLTTCIQTVFDDSRHTYGSNRVEAALRGEGICTSRKRVARLMRQHGLRSVREETTGLLDPFAAEWICRGEPAGTGLYCQARK